MREKRRRRVDRSLAELALKPGREIEAGCRRDGGVWESEEEDRQTDRATGREGVDKKRDDDKRPGDYEQRRMEEERQPEVRASGHGIDSLFRLSVFSSLDS